MDLCCVFLLISTNQSGYSSYQCRVQRMNTLAVFVICKCNPFKGLFASGSKCKL